MNIPPDLEDPNAPAGSPPPGLDPNSDFALKKQGSKTPMIVAGVVVVGVLGFFVVRSMQTQKTRELHAGVIKQFADIEKEEVTGKFWACLFGPSIDPAMFPNNLALSQRLDGAFAADPKNFPARVREECTPKALDAKHKIENMTAPPEYAEPLKTYATSLQGLSDAFDAWAKVAPSHVAEKMVGQKVETSGAAWHAFQSGKPEPAVIAYDRFLHCAVPGLDKMKDGQALVEFLFNSCKDPKYLDRLQNECGKEITSEAILPAPTPGFKAVITKMQADDREQSAFDDCLRKARKLKRSDDSGDVGRAWVTYMDAGHKVREVAKEALSEK
jgi:hypothetical protein